MTSTPFDPEQLPDSTAGTTGTAGYVYVQGSLKWAVALTAAVGKLLPFRALPEAF
jgi:hypothetical protein